MSYVRFSEDSEVYLIGTTEYPTPEHVIECCGCRLTADWRKPRTDAEREAVAGIDTTWAGMRPEDMEWDWGPVQHFRSNAEALAHLDAHVTAGHKVPVRAFDRIRGDDWLPENAESAVRAQLKENR